MKLRQILIGLLVVFLVGNAIYQTVQIAELKQKLSFMDSSSEISDIEDEVSAIKSSVETIDENVKVVEGTVSDIEGEVREIRNR